MFTARMENEGRRRRRRRGIDEKKEGEREGGTEKGKVVCFIGMRVTKQKREREPYTAMKAPTAIHTITGTRPACSRPDLMDENTISQI